MFKRIRAFFVTGILVLFPIFISFWICSWLFVSLTNFITKVLPQYSHNAPGLKLLWRITALILVVLVITMVGLITRIYIGRKLLQFGEAILVRIPIFSKFYIAAKQIIEAFLGSDRTVMRSVAMVEYPRKGLYTIVFITAETCAVIQEKTNRKVVNVFVPTTPNPTSGYLLMVPKEDLIPLEMSVEEGLKLVISGGTVNPEPRKNVSSQKAVPEISGKESENA
ncbi:MAG: DUF502 domain-containing protein [Candidatus Theseobacter exili]|nr:DUF502 domain-containing protein [Candidatus Theseobacter exili]